MKIKLLSIMLLLTTLGVKAQLNLIPKPVSVKVETSSLILNEKTAIVAHKKLRNEAIYLQTKLNQSTGYSFSIASGKPQNYIKLEVDANAFENPEAYTINVDGKGATIKAKNDIGIFWGIQTLLQMLPEQVYSKKVQAGVKWEIPFAQISDYPRFKYRGMMLDLSRQFFDTTFVKRYIDWLAAHKINVFHMHLTDDEGWRVEIKKHPILTEKGAWRGENEILRPDHGSGKARYGGFYTQQQLKEIVAYATKQKVEIIPEIDLPGHCKPITACYPNTFCDATDSTVSPTGYTVNVICPSKEANYQLVADIIDELAPIFPSKYFHIGGDEVSMNAWKKCPACQANMKKHGFSNIKSLHEYFNLKVDSILKSHNKQLIGWEEIVEYGAMPLTTTAIAWQGAKAGEVAARKGYKVVFAPAQNMYLDMKNTLMEKGHGWAKITPIEDVYAFEPFSDTDTTFTPYERANVIGVQGTLFAEYLTTTNFAESQSYPRLCAIAEIGWSQRGERSFTDFNSRLLSKHIFRLQNMGIHFRVNQPTLKYEDGKITASTDIRNGIIKYSMLEEPCLNSPTYSGPIAANRPEDYIFKTYLSDTLASAPVFIFPAKAAIWNIPEYKNFTDIQLDVTKAITQNGNWKAYFLPEKGETAYIKDVELYENGKLIASEKQEATIANVFVNNVYKLPVNSYQTGATYTLKFKIKGGSAVGNVYFMLKD